MASKRQFCYLLRPIRLDFGKSWTKEGEEIMGRHFGYLKKLTDEKTVILAGPCLDAAFGVVIFEVETEDAARQIMENDPAIKEGLMTAELHPFKVSLMREK